MGYRPTITCGKYSHEFGKFYGYVNLDNLKSINWLVEHKKLEDYADGDPEIVFTCCNPEIDFTAEEFREFIDLYQEDINGYDFSKWNINYATQPNFRMADYWEDFLEVYKNDNPVTIDWG